MPHPRTRAPFWHLVTSRRLTLQPVSRSHTRGRGMHGHIPQNPGLGPRNNFPPISREQRGTLHHLSALRLGGPLPGPRRAAAAFPAGTSRNRFLMKTHGRLIHPSGRPNWWSPRPSAAGDFLFASASDRAHARTDADSETKPGSQGSDRPIASPLPLPAPGVSLGVRGSFAGYSTL